jgi:hypothetical protein
MRRAATGDRPLSRDEKCLVPASAEPVTIDSIRKAAGAVDGVVITGAQPALRSDASSQTVTFQMESLKSATLADFSASQTNVT